MIHMSWKGKNEYRFGLKSGQGMYIIAKTIAKGMQTFYKDYWHRYLKSRSNKRMTRVDKMYAKERLESIHLWKVFGKDGRVTMPKKKLKIP